MDAGNLWCAGGKDCLLPNDKQTLRLSQSQRLCIGDACFGANEFRNMGRGGASSSSSVSRDFDKVTGPGHPNALTHTEARAICDAKGQQLCSATDLCPDGKPVAHLNKFGGVDNWIAVGDKQNEWVTYNEAGGRLCKTHTQVAGSVPAWSEQRNAKGQGWKRAVKCCARPASAPAPATAPAVAGKGGHVVPAGKGGLVVTGKDTSITNPDGKLRINEQGIMFGGPNSGKEVNSGQITAGLHIPNSLNIVGMSSGPGHHDRRVDVWAEGGLNIHGHIGNDPHVASANLVMGSKQEKNRWIYHHPNDDRKQVWLAPWNGRDWAWANAFNMHQNGHVHVAKSLNVGAFGDHNLHGWTGANFRRRDGRWTHFDWVGDQNNYIRGNTVSDGIISMQDNQLRLRGNGDGNHFLGWTGSVDGPQLMGHQGGLITTNRGGDKTIASWSHNGNFKVHNRLLLGNKWNMSGVGDGHANDDWLRLMGTDGSNYYGGLAAGRLWSSTGALSGSDATMKTDIRPVDPTDRAKFDQLVARKFRWRNQPKGRSQYGFVAQEVQKVLPEVVSRGPNGKLAMDYQQIVPLLVEEVQSLKEEVRELRA